MPHRIAWLALLLALVCAPAGPSFAQAAPDNDPDEIGEPDEPRGRGGREGRRAGREERRAVREAARQKEVACRRDAARLNRVRAPVSHPLLIRN